MDHAFTIFAAVRQNKINFKFKKFNLHIKFRNFKTKFYSGLRNKRDRDELSAFSPRTESGVSEKSTSRIGRSF